MTFATLNSMSSPVPSKRRRLNLRVESSDQETDCRSRDWSGSDATPPASPSLLGPHRGSKSPNTVRSHSPKTDPRAAWKSGQQKPRRRIHIVRNPTLVNDQFFSQIPDSSQSPHRIRGAYWQKPGAVIQLKPPSNPSIAESDIQGTDQIKRESSSVAAGVAEIPVHADEHTPDADNNGDNNGNNNMVFAEAQPIATVVDEVNGVPDDEVLLDELADIPLEMLHSPEETCVTTKPNAPQTNYRQTTLFGASGGQTRETQSGSGGPTHGWPLMSSNESPTHHKLDREALKTWVYPTNLGTVRDYQYNIVARGLFCNLLVALPTGLGKTFIAAAIMLNWYRWTKNAQIVFVAPTRPLVAQQVNACFHIAGIPRSDTSLLTGNVAPGLRAAEWSEKRVFFMTPQTIVNDLKTGICDPKRIVLLVVDEAHRATGNYAYVEVVRFLRRFNSSFRVLALTATPGSMVETVQEVIDGLGIARTEIRTENSLDIRQYVHRRNIETMLFDYSEDTQFVMDMLSRAVKPVLQKVTSMNIYWSNDPMTLTAFGCTQARQKWMASPAGRGASFGLKGMVNTIFTTLASLAHAIELLKFHGIGPFYRKALLYQDGDAESGKKGSKYQKQIIQHADFKTMMSTVRQWMNREDFLGHPKLEYLSQVVLNHFIDAGDGRGIESDISPAATRVMIFAHYRDSAEEIARVLQRHSPMVRAHVFVGQAASRGSDGMDQRKQQSIIDDFKKGTYNTLIATSIGEEGLDIGQVDLIICYDASASPIRMLQRMGRTGRKRAGNIVVLLMKKKEHENFERAKDNYEKMQLMIAEGSRFNYHISLSPRIVPREVQPVVDKRPVEIPIENSQADGELPEPKKKGRVPKRPPKKFHMPDGVVTGFLRASEFKREQASTSNAFAAKSIQALAPLPDLSAVLLTSPQEVELENKYLDIGGDEAQTVEFPHLDRFTSLQREERPSKLIGHGSATWRVINLMNTMHDMDEAVVHSLQTNLDADDKAKADNAQAGLVEILDHALPLAAHRNLSAETATFVRPSKKVSLTANSRRTKKQRAAMPRSNQKRQRAEAIEAPPSSSMPGTEGEGIDLMNTDDEHEFDDENSDNGSDLQDFIDDETPVEEPSSSSSPPEMTRRQGKGHKYHRSTEQSFAISLSQVTDASLPDASTLVGLVGQANWTGRHESNKGKPRGRAVISDDSESSS